MQREKSVETVENLGFKQESRLIGQKISNTTRYGVYCFDSPTRQAIWTVVGEQKAKIGCCVPTDSSGRRKTRSAGGFLRGSFCAGERTIAARTPNQSLSS
jgi:hypothetical protein